MYQAVRPKWRKPDSAHQLRTNRHATTQTACCDHGIPNLKHQGVYLDSLEGASSKEELLKSQLFVPSGTRLEMVPRTRWFEPSATRRDLQRLRARSWRLLGTCPLESNGRLAVNEPKNFDSKSCTWVQGALVPATYDSDTTNYRLRKFDSQNR